LPDAQTDTELSAASNGTGSINVTNATTAVDDTIAFNLDSGSTVTISTALPEITDTVTIDGNDSETDVTIQVITPGTSQFRVFILTQQEKLLILTI